MGIPSCSLWLTKPAQAVESTRRLGPQHRKHPPPAFGASGSAPPALTLARLSPAPASPLTQLRRSVRDLVHARKLCGEFLDIWYLLQCSGILARHCLLDRSNLLALRCLHDGFSFLALRSIGGSGDDGDAGAKDLLQSLRQRLDYDGAVDAA